MGVKTTTKNLAQKIDLKEAMKKVEGNEQYLKKLEYKEVLDNPAESGVLALIDLFNGLSTGDLNELLGGKRRSKGRFVLAYRNLFDKGFLTYKKLNRNIKATNGIKSKDNPIQDYSETEAGKIKPVAVIKNNLIEKLLNYVPIYVYFKPSSSLKKINMDVYAEMESLPNYCKTAENRKKARARMLKRITDSSHWAFKKKMASFLCSAYKSQKEKWLNKEEKLKLINLVRDDRFTFNKLFEQAVGKKIYSALIIQLVESGRGRLISTPEEFILWEMFLCELRYRDKALTLDTEEFNRIEATAQVYAVNEAIQ